MHNELSTTQRISATDKEWTTVTPESHVTYDLVGWILRFSTDVITVKPIILVDEVLYRLSSLTVLYEQEG